MLHGRDLVDLEQLRQSHFGYRLAALAGKHEWAAAVAERPRRFLILLASLRLRPRRRTGRAEPRTPEVDGRTPLFGLPGSASQRVGLCTPMLPSAWGSRPKKSLQEGGRAVRKLAGAARLITSGWIPFLGVSPKLGSPFIIGHNGHN